MKVSTLLAATVLSLAIGEALALLAADTAPLTVGKPFRTKYEKGYQDRYRFYNHFGNQSDLDRGQRYRLGIFGNSFAISEAPQEKLWPDLVRQGFDDVHVENYSAGGANYHELKAMLTVAEERREKFDAIIIVLSLSSAHDPDLIGFEESAFRYSGIRRSCEKGESCLLHRLSDIMSRQEKTDPLLTRLFKIGKSVGVSSAQAATDIKKEDLAAELLKSQCLADNIYPCREEYRAEVSKRNRESKGAHIGFDERMSVYRETFLGCQKRIDDHCGIVRSTERIKFKPPTSWDHTLIAKQIQALEVLGEKVSDRVFLLISPFAMNPENDPINLATSAHAELNRVLANGTFMQDADLVDRVKRSDQILRTVLRTLHKEHIEIQEPLDRAAKSETEVFSDIGHVTELGHQVVAHEIIKALQKAQVFSTDVVR